MKEEFVDSDNKIITECPDCSNQSALYIISSNRIQDSYQIQHCDYCKKPYVVFVMAELTVKTTVFSCTEIKETK